MDAPYQVVKGLSITHRSHRVVKGSMTVHRRKLNTFVTQVVVEQVLEVRNGF